VATPHTPAAPALDSKGLPLAVRPREPAGDEDAQTVDEQVEAKPAPQTRRLG
jgi:hypothetical protein